MKTKDVISLRVALLRLKDNLRPNEKLKTKFAYAVSRNLDITLSVFNAYQEAAAPTNVKGFSEWEAARRSYLESVCNKNEDGTPRIIGNDYDIPDLVAATEALNKLRETDFPDLETDIAELRTTVEALGEEETNIEIYKAPIDVFPEDIQVDIMDSLMIMVRD